eukprot:TRINITY_DN8308_c0_g1_i4.p2 TRINITY_DN8308_c0_g1~~TRINITY_DN8308_c0_g1_i4.p2  ORF type:complete len:108 (+),score=33.52 TRINITY_DN8308_c0_g1_i4:3-326(+)
MCTCLCYVVFELYSFFVFFCQPVHSILCFFVFFFFFFFLGELWNNNIAKMTNTALLGGLRVCNSNFSADFGILSVSYTHLTLPTICSVQISVVAVSLKKKKKKEKYD